ncbi:SPOR domain-containing protein [Allosphingosinicella sp.]|jgi:Flp pilus assembly protein TadD|uniref:SPOR domain-containing protein n=1 Tax=Allosphingosinicella sp. TaxID=2823234 RepID=UPI002F1B97BE
MNSLAMKFVASTAVVALTLGGFRTDMALVQAASASTGARADRQASRVGEEAREALQRGNIARALTLAERAVELAPQDVGYRMLLADLYLRNGRFASAETSYEDVLQLDPVNERAALSVVLTRIAQGRNADAVAQLEVLVESAPASDVGLAFALAGQPRRAIELLEPAARAPGANGRTRQNLALAYALSGDWQRARAIAAQDVSPAELGPRLHHWASLAQPTSASSQVASLLGVTPQADPGQPIRLALAEPQADAVAFAAAEPAPEVEAAAEAPVQLAEASVPEPVPAPVEPAPESPIRYAEAPVLPAPVEATPARSEAWWPAAAETAEVRPSAPAAPVEAPEASPAAPVRFASSEPAPQSWPASPPADEAPVVRHAAAPRVLTASSPLVRASTQIARAPRPTFEPVRPRRIAASTVPLPRPGSNGQYVVQLGAFSNSQNAERAWQQAQSRFGLARAEPRTTTINIGGRTLHRVSVGGFEGRADANRACASIRAQGGACFVRATAGDVPVRWASRSTRSRGA